MWHMKYTLNFGFEKKLIFDQYPVVNPAEFEKNVKKKKIEKNWCA